MSFLIILLMLQPLPLEGHADQDPDPKTFGYVLQAEELGRNRAEALAELARSNRDWLVLDSSYDGTPDGHWTTGELQRIRKGKSGRKLVAYLSIGEAEAYRAYWHHDWDANEDGHPDPGAPSFLERQNESWTGNYKVHYWDARWQEIILERLNNLMARGFDGVYLDIVDAFEYYEYDAESDSYNDHRVNPSTGQSYRKDMIEWVQRIARTARRQEEGFLVIPQNGAQLTESEAYLQTISGQAVEDLYTNGAQRQSTDHTEYISTYLQTVRQSGKPVILVEYALQKKLQTYIRRRCSSSPFNTVLMTSRALDELGRSLRCN